MKKQFTFLINTLLLIQLLVICPVLHAQQASTPVQGHITDEFGKPLQYVTINSENGKNGSSTDKDGAYSIQVDDGSRALLFSIVGFASKKVAIEDSKKIDVQLSRDAHHKDDVVELGYTIQRRSEISGAVATVTGQELERSPVANFTQTLAGRLSGLITQETYSELSRATTNLYVRGLSAGRDNGPVVIIDGIVVSYNTNETLEYISPFEVESVSVLKDASTQALYGIQGGNGVIVVKTKRGVKGALKVKVRLDQAVQQVTTKPTFYNSAQYAEMRNQAAFNDGLGENYFYSDQQINNYRSGSNKELYPNNNWYDQYMKDFANMQRANVSLTGGNDKVQFFSNINFMHQGGQFKTSQDKYNPDANNVWVNYRSNVDMKINKYLSAFVRLGGNIKRERTPGVGNATVYSSIFQIPSNVYGPLTPVTVDENGDPTGGNQVVTTERVAAPTLGMLNRTGYVRHTVTNITSQFGLDLDMSFLTKGLTMSGVFAYQTNSVGSLATTQDYERWIRTDNADTLAFIKKGSETNTPLTYSKTHLYYYHLTSKASLNYQRDFGKHSVSGMGYMFYQNLTKSDVSSPALLPYNRVSTGVEATYGYDRRYFVKFDLGYSGSEQYARSSRYVSTPAVSAAWNISNESFMQRASWLTQLKLRASYGKTANDQSGLARYAYLDNVTVSGGGPIGYLQYNIKENQKGNPNIQAEISTKQNVGIDLGLFNSISISADLFKERMENMVVSAVSTIPSYQGIPLESYPSLNAGTFENKGYEISVNYNKQLNADWNISLGAMYSYANNKVININEATRTKDYAFRKWQEGYSYGQQFGYQVDYSNGNGFFNTATELQNHHLEYSFGTPRLGDLIYKDLNGDGKIDDRDKAPVGTGMIPRSTYAFSGGVTYKSLALNFLFQGVAGYSTMLSGTGIWESDYDGVFGALHAGAWTQERYQAGNKITWSALSLAQSVNQQLSDYVNYNRSYLRLKNIELSYTLPSSVSKVISSENIRVLVSGQNLITWDKMKSADFGPEGGGYLSFPVYRVYNVGISVTF